MQGPETWRDILRTIIAEPGERERVAAELEVTPQTLEDWVQGEATPRPQHLYKLLMALSQQSPHYRELLQLIAGDFERSIRLETPINNEPGEIAIAFYDRVLNASLNVPMPLRFWVISNLILQQALMQLNPRRLGMSLVIVRCMPPSQGEKVRSLRGSIGLGTPPWKSDLEPQAAFMGIESLAGYAVSCGHIAVVEDIFDQRLTTSQRDGYAISSMAAPIMRAEGIAGCLLASSTQPGYFVAEHLKLFQNYTSLLALAFMEREFYALEQIELCVLPPTEEQKSHLATFRQRVIEVMTQAARDREPLDVTTAEDMIWRRLEAEVLALGS